MKLSEVTLQEVKNNLGYTANNQDNLIQLYMEAAKAYIVSYTGLTEEQLDEHNDITFAFLALVMDMFLNRSATAEKACNDNKTVKTILGMHAVNYL